MPLEFDCFSQSQALLVESIDQPSAGLRYKLTSVVSDNSKVQSVAGKAEVHWKDGIRAMVESHGLLNRKGDRPN